MSVGLGNLIVNVLRILFAVFLSGTAYRIRVKSDNPAVIGSDNGSDVEIVNTTGINDISKSEINIYPNPISDILYFDNLNNENVEVKVFDNFGKLVLYKEISEKSINISNLSNGFYTIIVKNSNFVKSSKFVKQ